jgi:hypothetical protein
VDTRFAATFLLSALVVEVAARLLGTERPLRLAVVSGLGIGTIGLAGEWVWNADAAQPWTGSLLPEAVVLSVVAAVGAAVIGVAFARAITGEAPARAVPGRVVAVAALACLAVILVPMRRPTGDVEASVHLEQAEVGGVFVVATLSPADAADDAYWFQATAWQGGGLVLAKMEATGEPGQYRSDKPVPVDGLWKSLLRLHRGAEMMALPVYLPADPEIDEPAFPAVDRTASFASEKRYLLRETHEGNGWLSPLIHLTLVAVCCIWAVAFVLAVRSLTGRDDLRPTRHREPVPEPV